VSPHPTILAVKKFLPYLLLAFSLLCGGCVVSPSTLLPLLLLLKNDPVKNPQTQPAQAIVAQPVPAQNVAAQAAPAQTNTAQTTADQPASQQAAPSPPSLHASTLKFELPQG